MLCDVPLTSKQQDFAADNHGLVYKFLKENHLSADEFYDVIIFGYLRAVKRYFTEPDLQRYKFATIAWNCMRVDLCNYYKSLRRQKRNAEVFSIHIGFLEETIPGQDDLMQQLETKLLLHELAGKVSRQQMDLIHLKTCGYNLREISRHQKTSMKRVKELLDEVYMVLLDLCYES